jgi:Putative transposase/Transposase zinc-binding domain
VERAAPCPDGARSPPRVSVGDIARAHGAALRASYALTTEQHRVLNALERCRTALLGGHMHICDTCGYAVPVYNSCRNRHCPTCQSLEQHRWLERRRETILPVPYFHLVFTLPSELRLVVAMNRERMFALMFEAASKTVLMLSRDPKRLGGTPALTMVLHTWTRQLTFHPHLHAIVSAGAMNEDGAWVHSREDYLFPVKVMARLFRRLFREAVLVALDRGELAVTAEHDAAMRKALFQTHWIVYAKAPFGGADQVFAYLGRYTHRVGISNARIQSAHDNAVTFATKNGRSCTLAPVEFLRRFLLHVLPSGFHKIRHYGLCASHHVAQGTIHTLRQELLAHTEASNTTPSSTVQRPPEQSAALAPITTLECMLALTGIDVLRCPRCAHGRMLPAPLPDTCSAPHRLDTS